MIKKLGVFKTMEAMMAYYYPGRSLLRKAVEVSEAAGSGTHWEPIYGKKVWSWLNLEANIFAMLPKEPWVKTGWRVLTTAAHTSGGGVDESTTGGSVPTPLTLTFEQVSQKPKRMAHTFDIGELADFLGGIDDAVDLLPFYREEIGKEHAFCINLALGQDVDTPASYNFESIDRVVSSNEEGANLCTAATDPDMYGSTARSTGTTWDAYVNENDDTDRDLTLTLIDTTYQNVLDNGGIPKVILTRTNALMRWQQLLEAERRFMDSARVVPTFGGVRGPMPGVEAGFMVATYFGIPILPSQHVQNRDTIGSITFLDTDFVKLAIAKPTTYSESGRGAGFIYRGLYAIEGMYDTLAELRAYRFNAHGKLVDLQ